MIIYVKHLAYCRYTPEAGCWDSSLSEMQKAMGGADFVEGGRTGVLDLSNFEMA